MFLVIFAWDVTYLSQNRVTKFSEKSELGLLIITIVEVLSDMFFIFKRETCFVNSIYRGSY